MLFLLLMQILAAVQATVDASIPTSLLQAFRNIAAPNRSQAQAALLSAGSPTDAIASKFLSLTFAASDQEAILFAAENAVLLQKASKGVPEAALHSILRDSNQQISVLSQTRLEKRKERLHAWHLEELGHHHTWTEHNAGLKPWNRSIRVSESLKSTRSRQDRHDSWIYYQTLYRTMRQTQERKSGAMNKWALDETEGRDRMRLRLVQSSGDKQLEYRPKRARRTSALSPNVKVMQDLPLLSLPLDSQAANGRLRGEMAHNGARDTGGAGFEADLDFEAIENEEDQDLELEDKNRKVMRSLQRGEQVINVFNVSRIRGLEALEVLLILGNKALYMVDNLFQRADGEVVYTADAPSDERDPFVQMIAGRKVQQADEGSAMTIQTRHWPWNSIISISKRSFLSRPVALEIFFEDGRSYLLTAHSLAQRDELWTALFSRSLRMQSSAESTDPEAWRANLLPNAKDPLPSMAGRLVTALSLGSSLSATARWVRGEISNFQYLMLINTLAGRTFNDLTQYPVFPWVISDYTSETLDLTDPRSFRDLSKPMGCQTPEREKAFRERYRSFADMGDEQTPAFHYGTHYSSAMIVTSYLIRLQPYVDAYLLLQGGNFDHADRLFYSLEKAWTSASSTNMTDVRELTPEFFYLPEFLRNDNNFDFGRRDANGEQIHHVQLPPWAKGDAEIFIRKNREALESPYVSKHLQHWIDLVFGFKQQGEAAKDATNVFHYLSYQGARNIENIDDPMERLATINIIHSFGQTPRQIFTRPHETREVMTVKAKRLHRAIDSLTKLPNPIYEYHSGINELAFSQKQQRLLCCGPQRCFMHGSQNVVLEWGYADKSVRFFSSESKKCLGIYEQLHQATITVAKFADTTLITASEDCTVGLWLIKVGNNAVDLHPKSFLFGHRSPIVSVAVSRILSTVVSADASGIVHVWDLNTYELIRTLELPQQAQVAQINNTTGRLLFACGPRILLYSLNGSLLLNQAICASSDESIASCAFYETSANDWIDTDLIFTGHSRGMANAWSVTTRTDGVWTLELLRQMDHTDYARSDGPAQNSAITAICPLDHVVYTGDQRGRVYEWACVR